MKGLRTAMRELAAALAVIAVFALTFVYQPFMPSVLHRDGVQSIVSSGIICGDPDDHGAVEHGPCHACRFDAAALPSPPDCAWPAYGDFSAAVYAPETSGPVNAVWPIHFNPRAPPVVV